MFSPALKVAWLADEPDLSRVVQNSQLSVGPSKLAPWRRPRSNSRQGELQEYTARVLVLRVDPGASTTQPSA